MRILTANSLSALCLPSRSTAGARSAAPTWRCAPHHRRVCSPGSQRKPIGRRSRLAATGGAQEDDLEVAVFRFTLGALCSCLARLGFGAGIPGFDDALIPRAVGFLGGGLLLANHFAGSEGGVPDAQARTEVLGIVLAVLGIATPSIEQRLKDMDPRRGRKQQAESIPGSANFFGISGELAEDAKRDLAWASFALLKNTNTAGVMVMGETGEVLLARGAVGAVSGSQPLSLSVLSEAARAPPSTSMLGKTPREGGAYLRDAASIYEAGGQQCAWLPGGAASLLLVPMAQGAWLCLWSERPRALSRKEQQWAAAVAAKLSPYLPAKS